MTRQSSSVSLTLAQTHTHCTTKAMSLAFFQGLSSEHFVSPLSHAHRDTLLTPDTLLTLSHAHYMANAIWLTHHSLPFRVSRITTILLSLTGQSRGKAVQAARLRFLRLLVPSRSQQTLGESAPLRLAADPSSGRQKSPHPEQQVPMLYQPRQEAVCAQACCQSLV